MNTSFTRAPPPQGGPPAYAMVTRVYRRSLRPVVLAISLISAAWALVWGISMFRDISIDKQHAVRLEVFDIVLGILYMVIFVIELFGLAASFLQKLPLIRIYAFLSLGVALIVFGTDLLRVVIHFVFKNTLINECTDLATGKTITTRFGIWGVTTETLDGESASEFCSDAWNHDSWSEIGWFIVSSIMALLFASVAFSYYRQMLDPASVVNSSRTIPPQNYQPPYVGSYAYGNAPYGSGNLAGSNVNFGGASGYAPPAGPPPGFEATAYDSTKLPDYERGGYLGADGDKKDDDLKGGEDPFADFEGQRNAEARSSAAHHS